MASAIKETVEQSKGGNLASAIKETVEQSKGGTLASAIKETVRRLSPTVGFNLKVVENNGSSLGSILSSKNIWAGQAFLKRICRIARSRTFCMSQCAWSAT